MSLTNLVTNTGPTSATMSPMAVDLVFNAVPWGVLQLPSVVTTPTGTTVLCAEQVVRITNQAAFRAFVRALMRDEQLVLTLDNGECRIASKIFGFTARTSVVYRKDLVIRGMGGPVVALAGVAGEGREGRNTLRVANPSPLEIDHGVSCFNVVKGDGEGVVVARLRGPLYMVRGDFDSTLDITFVEGVKVAPGEKVRLVGTGTEKESWMNETLKYIDSEFEVDERFATLSGWVKG